MIPSIVLGTDEALTSQQEIATRHASPCTGSTCLHREVQLVSKGRLAQGKGNVVVLQHSLALCASIMLQPLANPPRGSSLEVLTEMLLYSFHQGLGLQGQIPHNCHDTS